MICIVTCTHPPDDERIYFKQIKTLLKAQYFIYYYTFWDTKIDLSEENLVHINCNPKMMTKSKFIQLVLDFLLSKNNIKSLHIHEFDLLSLIKKIKVRSSIKTIYDVHEAHLEMWDVFSSRNYLFKRIINYFLWQNEKSKLKYVDQIITVTNILVKRYNAIHKKVIYLPNYPILIKQKIKKIKSKNIIYHGQLSDERGILNLLEAFSIINKKEKLVKLYLAGAPKNKEFLKKIEQFIIKNKMESNVLILGLIKHEEMIEILHNCMVGIIPFKDNKFTRMGLPVKLFEFMMTKCAIVTVDFPLIKSHIGDSCLYFKSGDIKDLSNKIYQIISNNNLCNSLVNSAFDLVYKKYNWEKIESDLIDFYKQ